MKLYPQFQPIDRKGSTSDKEILLRLVRLSPTELERLKESFDADSFEHSKIGNIAEEADIKALCDAMQAAAVKHGYPETPNKTKARAVDKEWGEIMHRMMGITRNEASKSGVWNALSCHYLPNLVAWRWENPKKPADKISDRWLVQNRQERHAFGRLWWRYEILKDSENTKEPYWILTKLQEDEIVQIMERSALSSCHEIVLGLAKAHLANKEDDGEGRMEAFRRAIKLLCLRASIRDLGIITAKSQADEFTARIYAEANDL